MRLNKSCVQRQATRAWRDGAARMIMINLGNYKFNYWLLHFHMPNNMNSLYSLIKILGFGGVEKFV